MQIQAIFSFLETASNDRMGFQQQQIAMKKLEEMELLDGFFISLLEILQSNCGASHLQSIASSMSLDCKLLCVIMLKNAVYRRWVGRGGQVKLVRPEEQSFIKESLLQIISGSLGEFTFQKKIATQLSLTISKIARHDWPNNWNDLFPRILTSIQFTDSSNNVIAFARRSFAMLCLRDVMNELSQKTLSFSKTSLSEISRSVFSVTSSVWFNELNITVGRLEMIHQSQQNLNSLVLSLDHLVIGVEVIKKLLEFAFFEICLDKNILFSFMNSFIEGQRCLTRFLQHLQNTMLTTGIVFSDINEMSSSFYDQLYVNIRILVATISSLPLGLQKTYPLDFVPFLEPFIELYYSSLKSDSTFALANNIRLDFRSYTINYILFLSNVIGSDIYLHGSNTSGQRNSIASKSRRLHIKQLGLKLSEEPEVDDNVTIEKSVTILRTFFTNEKINDLFEMCLSSLLQFNQNELEEWKDDPEIFYIGQQSLTESDTIKAASEMLFLALLDFNTDLIANSITRMIQNINLQLHALNSKAEKDILYWDAVYLCCGLGVSKLSSYINSNDWLSQFLGPLFQKVVGDSFFGSLTGGQQILRFRIVWLLSCWMYHWETNALNILSELVVIVFEVHSSSDIVTTLTALQTLENIFRSQAFSSELFHPLIGRLIEALCAFINRLEENESKARVIETIGEVALIIGPQVEGVLDALVHYIGSIWTVSDDKSPLRRSILETITIIVNVSKEKSYMLHSVVLPLINFAITGSVVSKIQCPINENGESDGTQSYLFLEGLSLWLAVMRHLVYQTNQTSYSNQLDTLASSCLNTIFSESVINMGTLATEMDTEDIKIFSMILESYGIHGQHIFLQSNSQYLAMMYSKLLGQVEARVVPYLLRPIESLALTCPAETNAFLIQSGCLFRMLQSCFARVQLFRELLQDFIEPEICIVSYLSVIARLMLGTDGISSILHILQYILADLQRLNATSINVEMLFQSILQLFIDMFDFVGGCTGGTWRRKLWCLALLSIYPTDNPSLLQLFGNILVMTDSVLCEEDNDSQEKISSNQLASSLVHMSAEDAAFINDTDTNESIVLAMCHFVEKDIVFSSNLLVLVKDKFQGMRDRIGDAALGNFVQGLPQSLLQRILS